MAQTERDGQYEYRVWLRQATLSSDDIEAELNRLNRDFGWRLVTYMTTAAVSTGFFILERPIRPEAGAAMSTSEEGRSGSREDRS